MTISRTPPTPKRGDLVVTRFLFEDGRPSRIRPVVVISNDGFNTARSEVVVRALSARLSPLRQGDCLLRDWQRVGLRRPSRVTASIRTVPATALLGRVGALTAPDWRLVRSTTANDILDLP